ncbi:MAG: helix-turn-helix domain-containing protein [Bryobacteraceae bacterium]
MRLGYARVSTQAQTIDLQKDTLRRARCREVYKEHEFERNLIRERTVAGLKAVRARRRKGGRPAKLSTQESKTIRALLRTADIPVAEIAARFGIARSTPYRAVLNRAV